MIYHEAALEPFSLNEFQYTAYPLYSRNKPTIQLFIEAMAPTQARAIRRFRVVSDDGSFLRPVVVRQLKGLEHLSIEVECSTAVEWCMRRLCANEGVTELRKLSLKSVYISLEVKSNSICLTLDTAAVIALQEDLEGNYWPKHEQRRHQTRRAISTERSMAITTSKAGQVISESLCIILCSSGGGTIDFDSCKWNIPKWNW